MLALGGLLECRSNWRIYVEEFCFAITWLTSRDAECGTYEPNEVMTPLSANTLSRDTRSIVPRCSSESGGFALAPGLSDNHRPLSFPECRECRTWPVSVVALAVARPFGWISTVPIWRLPSAAGVRKR